LPKGDADKLRADLDDGYAKVSNLLLEMLACAPLTATEMRVVFFIMRRTYGWAKGADRNSGKADVMTAEDIAGGIGKPVSTVEKALGSLVRQRVVLRLQTQQYPGAKCAYGVNVEMAEWGDGPDWRETRVAHRQAYQDGAYSCRNLQQAVAGNGNRQLPKPATDNGNQLPKPATATGNEANSGTASEAPTAITSTDSSTAREDSTPAPAREDTCHNPITGAAFHFWKDGRAPGGLDNWTQQLVSAFRTEQAQSDALTEEEVVASFADRPPLPSEWPDKWIARCHNMMRDYSAEGRRKRDAAETMPVVPKFVSPPELTDEERAAADAERAKTMKKWGEMYADKQPERAAELVGNETT